MVMQLNEPWLSPLGIDGPFVWGWARNLGAQPQSVHLLVDGQQVGTEFTGATLPKRLHAVCGRPGGLNSGFSFALPGVVLDGFVHVLAVSAKALRGETVHSQPLTYRNGMVCGVVQQRGQQFIGTVWLQEGAPAGCELHVESCGRVVHKQPLKVGQVMDQRGYPARFAVSCNELPDGVLHFSCNGQPLRGSPCAREQKLIGVLRDVSNGAIQGWALDGSDISRPIELVLRVDGRPTEWFRPNVRRPDICEYLGVPEEAIGLAGFSIPAPKVLDDGLVHVLEVVSAVSGEPLTHGKQSLQRPMAGVAWKSLLTVPNPHINTTLPAAVPAPVKPLVSLVILNRNGVGVLEAFLESWVTHNHIVPVEIIIVDHASTDGSLDLLEVWQNRCDLITIARQHNASFSESCNLGARSAKGQFLLFMNNDIVWLQDALPTMLESLQEVDVGIVGIKLLKVVGESVFDRPVTSDVQHLGVRFKISGTGYWPFEVSPTCLTNEAEYAPQFVPAVTGAVLLCRKDDFFAIGGFDPSYFYGFEDVEFCLRFAYRLRKTVVCRNDCVALHRHGHTRLSGREISIYDKVLHNSKVLEGQVGVWLKQAYWRSLVRGDGYMTRERLSIGIVVDANPHSDDNTPMVRDALDLCRNVMVQLPNANLLLLHPGADWKNVRNLHILVVGDLRYDIRSVVNQRSDLLTVAWVREDPVKWVNLPWMNIFGGVLAPASQALRFGKVMSSKVEASSKSRPLGEALSTERWRLRVLLEDLNSESTAAKEIKARLRLAGLACWDSRDVQGFAVEPMADVVITIRDSGTPELSAAFEQGCLRVKWSGDMAKAPNAEWLESEMEAYIERAFCAP